MLLMEWMRKPTATRGSLACTDLDIQRSDDCIFLQITLNTGRTLEAKKRFYKAVADGLHEELQVRREDVLINLVEVRKEDWSFGNGEAQYA
jgi:4-oxalocrotonate tautomerase